MCSPHPRTPGAYKVASGDAPGHWPMFVTYSGCTMRAFAKLYDYILHQLGPHKHLRRRHRAMVSNPGSITQTHSMCYQGFYYSNTYSTATGDALRTAYCVLKISSFVGAV